MARGISGRRQHDSNRIDNEGADCRVQCPEMRFEEPYLHITTGSSVSRTRHAVFHILGCFPVTGSLWHPADAPRLEALDQGGQRLHGTCDSVGEIRQFVAWSIFLSFRIVKEVATMKSWLRILRSKCRNAR
jgi:hypothetical protein